MTPSHDLEDRLTALLEAKAAARAPDGLLTRTLAGTARERRRPGWRIPERWLPMSIALRPAVLPRAVPLTLLLTAITLVIVFAAIIGIGGSPRDERAAMLLPPPTGPARNGLIAYDAYGDIWVMQADGSDRRQLTSGPTVDIGPTWSPDGTSIAYLAYPNDSKVDHVPSAYSALLRSVLAGPASLMVMRADGSEPTSLGEPAYGLTFGWAPDSRRLAYSHALGTGATATISVVSLDLPGSVDVATGDAGPAWSPDGESIAYRGLRYDSSRRGTYLASADGSEATCSTSTSDPCRRLTQELGDVNAFGSPQWFPAPQSDRIATYAGGTAASGHDILVVNADGSGETNITNTTVDEYYPAWSPAGDRLAFDRQVDPAHNLVEMVISNVDGSEAFALESEPLFGMLPTWSPDGTMLVGQLPAQVTAGWQWDAASDLVVFDTTPGGASMPPRLLAVEGAYGQQSWQRLGPES
jgi:Tol biopolymer transport system component